MSTIYSMAFGIGYVVCIFICFIAILVYINVNCDMTLDFYDNEAMGWIFVISIVWPFVLIAFIWSVIWKKVVKKICVSLVETLTSKINQKRG